MRFFYLVIALSLIGAFRSESTTYNAASASFVDVSNAVALTTHGDTVTIPAGIVAWTNTINVSNSISIIGAGTNLTIITNNVTQGIFPWPLFHVYSTNDTLIRFSGIWFELTTNQAGWRTSDSAGKTTSGAGEAFYCDPLRFSSSPILHALRVDHCSFAKARDRSFQCDGSVYGVCDHCTFIDCATTTEPVSGHDKEWNRFTTPYYGLGTTNTFVIETCYLTWTAWATNAGGQGAAPAACGQGGHYVWRYNFLTNGFRDSHPDGWDLHGNNFYYNPSLWRGSIWLEYYNNTNWFARNQFRIANLRGGTVMMFSNAFWAFGASGDNPTLKVELSEEEGYDAAFVPLLTTYPAQDQITNSFFWANSTNGSAGQSGNFIFLDRTSNIWNQVNRDYWTNSPWATHYTNGEGAIDLMTNYQPLIYPHPLVTAMDSGGAIIGVSPSSLNFGVLIPVGSSNLTVVVTNSGNAFLDGVVTTSSPFSIAAGSPYSVAPADSSIVTITFTPTTGGAASGTATFTGGGGATVSLSGSQIPVTGTKISGNVTISGATVIK